MYCYYYYYYYYYCHCFIVVLIRKLYIIISYSGSGNGCNAIFFFYHPLPDPAFCCANRQTISKITQDRTNHSPLSHRHRRGMPSVSLILLITPRWCIYIFTRLLGPVAAITAPISVSVHSKYLLPHYSPPSSTVFFCSSFSRENYKLQFAPYYNLPPPPPLCALIYCLIEFVSVDNFFPPIHLKTITI